MLADPRRERYSHKVCQAGTSEALWRGLQELRC